MKTITITYCCDYCKQVINQDDETVRAILPGRIGYQEGFQAESDDEIRHYHDYCLEHLLTMEFQEEDSEPEEEEQKPEPVKKERVDHGRIVALYTARDPWSIKDIADDVGCIFQTVINHLKKEGLYK